MCLYRIKFLPYVHSVCVCSARPSDTPATVKVQQVVATCWLTQLTHTARLVTVPAHTPTSPIDAVWNTDIIKQNYTSFGITGASCLQSSGTCDASMQVGIRANGALLAADGHEKPGSVNEKHHVE